MEALLLVPALIIGAAAYGLFVHLPIRCARRGWRITLYGFFHSF
jgi:hypothetical protein